MIPQTHTAYWTVALSEPQNTNSHKTPERQIKHLFKIIEKLKKNNK